MQYIDKKINYRIPLFCFVTLLFWFSLYTYVPIFTSYVEDLGASHEMAGIIVGSYGFVQMVLRIPLGIMSDRMHKRRLFINFGLFFSMFSAIGLFFSKSLTLILIFRSFAGASAASWVDFTVLFMSYYKHEESTKAIGVISFYNSLGQMLAMLIGSVISEKVNSSFSFLLAAIVGGVALTMSLFLYENYSQNSEKISISGILEVIKNKNLLIVSTIAILSQIITFATVFGFTPIYAKGLGAGNLQMGLLTVFSSLPTAVASLIGAGKLAKKIGEKKVIILGFVLMGVFTITIPYTKTLFWLYLTQSLSGFGRGFSFPVLMALSVKDMPSDKRATAMGFFQSIYGLGMFAGPAIMGIIGDRFNLQQGFIIFGVVGCVTAVLSQILIKIKVNQAVG